VDDQRPDLDAARLALGEGRQAGGAGSDNPVGMRWIGTGFSGVGIHGVPASEDYSIGSYASHGCIRMYEWDVEQLLQLGHRGHADHHQAVGRRPTLLTLHPQREAICRG